MLEDADFVVLSTQYPPTEAMKHDLDDDWALADSETLAESEMFELESV